MIDIEKVTIPMGDWYKRVYDYSFKYTIVTFVMGSGSVFTKTAYYIPVGMTGTRLFGMLTPQSVTKAEFFAILLPLVKGTEQESWVLAEMLV